MDIYNKTVFKKFFDINDQSVMDWSDNVFEKIKGNTIMPSWINKDGEDFESYWKTICHLFALVVLYGRKYREIDSNEILFELFVKNRGLITNLFNTTEEMQYLFNNYIAEYKKRGTIDIVNKEGAILGELLRLIEYKEGNEFIFGLLTNRDTGWTLGFSSPCWRRTDTILNVSKGPEYSKNVEDLSKYALINPTGVVIVPDFDNEKKPINVMTFVGNGKTGIYPEENITKDKLMLIDPNLDYQFNLDVKLTGNPSFNAGVVFYDKFLRPISTSKTIDGFDSFKTIENVIATPDVYGNLQSNDHLLFPIVKQQLTEDGKTFERIKRTKIDSYPTVMDLCSTISIPNTKKPIKGKKIKVSFEARTSVETTSSVTAVETSPIHYLPDHDSTIELSTEWKTYSYMVEVGTLSTLNILRVNPWVIDMKGTIADFYLDITGYSIELIEENEIGLPDTQNYYNLKNILWNKNKTNNTEANFLNGQSLIIPSEAAYVGLVAHQDRGLRGGSVFLYNVSFKPLELPINQGYLGEKDVIALYAKNNALLSQEYIKTFTNTYLLSYRNKLAMKTIEERSLKSVLIKVISDRRFYLEGTLVTINGITKTTDRNGEVLFFLYEGSYSVSATRPRSVPFGVEELIVVNEETQTYCISMTGEIYERKVTFSVRDKDGIPLSGTSVTFQEETKQTGPDGTVVFSSLPGLYSYIVERPGYYRINKSVLIVDQDVLENVVMELIPLYSVTFYVKDSLGVAVSDAMVTFNNTSKTTDSLGVVVFTGIVAGNYDYSIEKQEWLPSIGELSVTSDQVKDITFLPIPTYEVVFRAYDKDNTSGQRSLLVGARVDFAGMQKMTNAQGEATFIVKGGTYPYTISKEGLVTKNGTEKIDKDGVIEIDLLRPEYSTVFRVRGENNAALQGATVSVAGKVGTTNAQGEVSFQLTNNDYNYSVTKADYNPKSGSIVVLGQPQVVQIDLVQTTYRLTVTVREEGQISEGAEVIVRGIVKLTNELGQVFFDLPKGTYSYTVQKTIYATQVGSVDIVSQPVSKEISLVKKIGSVTFIVKDNMTGNFIFGAVITVDGRQIMTGNTGQANIQLKYGSYGVNVQKNDYNPIYQDVVVNAENQIVEILIGNREYAVTVSVRRQNGTGVPGASVIIDGKSGVTDSSGNMTFPTIKAGNYDVTVSKNGFLSQTESLIVNGTTSKVIILQYNTSPLTISVLKDGFASVGSVVRYVVYEDSSKLTEVSKGSIGTNSQGSVSISGPSSGVVVYSVQDSQCVSGGEISASISQGVATVRIYKALIFSIRSRSLPTIRGSHRYEFFGDSELRIESTSMGSSEYLDMSCKGYLALSEVKQWPVSFGLKGVEMFKGCINLSKIPDSTFPKISGNIVGWFEGCLNLYNYPSGLFTLTTGATDASNVFRGSGIQLARTNTFPSSITNFFSAFRDCVNLTTIEGSPFNGGVLFESTFNGCSKLTNVSGDTFRMATGATFFFGTFNGAGVRSYPNNLFRYNTRAEDFDNCFAGSQITAIPNDFFRYTAGKNFNVLCYDCKNLASVGTNAFPSTAVSFSWSFQGCISLTDITNIRVPNPTKITTWSQAFMGSGVQTIPNDFFSGQTALTTLSRTFKDCRGLISFKDSVFNHNGLPLLKNCTKLATMESFMENCSNFIGIPNSNCPIRIDSGGIAWPLVLTFDGNIEKSFLESCTNYNYAFRNCSKLDQGMAVSHVVSGSYHSSLIAPPYMIRDISHTETYRGTINQSPSGGSIKAYPSSWK